MSYNIRLGILSSISRIAEIIRKYNPDIVALQEGGKFWKMGECCDQCEFFAKNTGLPYYQFAGAIQHPPNGFFGIGVLSRHPVESSNIIRLHRESDEQRVLLYIKTKIYGSEINFFNCHLSINERERIFQAQQVTSFALKQGRIIIIAGDINDEAGSPTYMEITKSFLDSNESENNKTYPVPNPTKHLDHIFYKGNIEIKEPLKVLKEEGSDHYPVMAVFQMIVPK